MSELGTIPKFTALAIDDKTQERQKQQTLVAKHSKYNSTHYYWL